MCTGMDFVSDGAALGWGPGEPRRAIFRSSADGSENYSENPSKIVPIFRVSCSRFDKWISMAPACLRCGAALQLIKKGLKHGDFSIMNAHDKATQEVPKMLVDRVESVDHGTGQPDSPPRLSNRQRRVSNPGMGIEEFAPGDPRLEQKRSARSEKQRSQMKHDELFGLAQPWPLTA